MAWTPDFQENFLSPPVNSSWPQNLGFLEGQKTKFSLTNKAFETVAIYSNFNLRPLPGSFLYVNKL